MNIRITTALIVSVLALSGYAIEAEKPKATSNTWTYDGATYRADSSALTNLNKVQFDFMKLDAARKNTRTYIGISFNSWPVHTGDYKIRYQRNADDEVTIIAVDPVNIYTSKSSNTGLVHVTMKDGKLNAWANGVMMDIFPQRLKSRTGDGDSTRCSFNLTEP